MKLLTDEHIPPALTRGVKRALPEVDLLELRHTGLLGTPDPQVLAYAAGEERILITRDVRTVPNYAFERIQRGEVMPGVFIWRRGASLGPVLEDLLLILQVSDGSEWVDQVIYLPFI
jgi:hypothetical protein